MFFGESESTCRKLRAGAKGRPTSDPLLPPTKYVVHLQEENSGQPVAFIECLGGRMCVILHYCPPPTKLWNKAGKTTSKIYPNGPFESLWTVSFLRNRMGRSPATTTVAVSDFSAIGSHLYRHKMWYEWNEIIIISSQVFFEMRPTDGWWVKVLAGWLASPHKILTGLQPATTHSTPPPIASAGQQICCKTFFN